MTDKERQALDKLKADLAANKIKTFDKIALFLTMAPENLRFTGYKTREAGVLSMIQDAIKENNKLNKDFVKRFPD